MRKIIDGILYDTETATELARGDHNHELSQAWWALFQTRHGAFFEVATGHDGVFDELTPFTHAQALRFMEVNANHLVEKYFGSMQEPRPERFSRRTVIAAIDLLEKLTQADVTAFFLLLGPGVYWTLREEPAAKKKRLNDLKEFVDKHPHQQIDGSPLQDVIVEKAVSMLPGHSPDYGFGQSMRPAHEAFLGLLELDGYEVGEGKLLRSLPVDLGLTQADSVISGLLDKYGMTTPKGHLQEALDNHARGNWAAANSQIRSFFESALDEIANRVDPSLRGATSENRRAKLGAMGLLQSDLNEWSADGKNFINGLMKRLHPSGSHPGLSDERDSTFRLRVVLLTVSLILTRFDETVGSAP